MEYPVVLSIAGSDSSGGAGIQADIKTISALGAYAATAITAVTAQNTMGVTAVQGISPDIVKAQLDAVFCDLHVRAVKIGMLYSSEIIEVVADALKKYQPDNVVLDPVMISTSGSKLIANDAIAAMVSHLMPLSTIVTPNRLEAALIAGIKLSGITDVLEAAERFIGMGCNAVLIKGGDFIFDNSDDYLYTSDDEVQIFKTPRIQSPNTHGTGCTLSSAIATMLAMGEPLNEAVDKAKAYITKAIESGKNVTVGKGHGPVNHFFKPISLKKVR